MPEKLEHRSDTAWMPVARNIKRYACLDSDGKVVCTHYKASGMLRHGKSLKTGAVLKNGEVIPIVFVSLRASNGEGARLPYAMTAEAYQAVWRSDKSWTVQQAKDISARTAPQAAN